MWKWVLTKKNNTHHKNTEMSGSHETPIFKLQIKPCAAVKWHHAVLAIVGNARSRMIKLVS